MPQPYNYSIRPATDAFVRTLEFGDVLQKRKAAQEFQQRRQEVYAALGPNATHADYMRAVQALPEEADALLKRMESIDEAKRKAFFNAGSQAFAVLQADANGVIDPSQAVARLNEYADAFENDGDVEAAHQMRDAARAVQIDPSSGKRVLGVMLAAADGERFKEVADFTENDQTTLQKDFEFIKDKFGSEAAAEFAQFGRGNVVSVPLGNGQTYVGPAAGAPGMARWRENGMPEGTKTPADILASAEEGKTITAAEARAVKQSLGPNGKQAFEVWRQKNGIRVIIRTGTDANGNRVFQYEDGSIEVAP